MILGLGILGILGILGNLEGCSTKPATIERPAFQADSAYSYIEKQMSFGPRVPNSAAHMQCAVWLIEQLRACGAEVELQKGQMPDYRGEMQQIYNIIGHFGTAAQSPRILLGAHYDTRPWCDEEEDYSDRFYNVPGANDGASGVGVLLEVARQIGLRNDSTTAVDIIFFDCEDMGSPRVYTGVEREDTWCLGSQLWAAAESGKGKAESGKGKGESGKGKTENGKEKAESGKRPFRIVKVALNRDREELYARINRRVEQMVKDGLVEEARAVYPKRHLNSLQTVGFRELFGYFDGKYDLARAIELIQQNTRHYAKRQLTWFRRDKDLFWLNANDDNEKNISLIDALLRSDRL